MTILLPRILLGVTAFYCVTTFAQAHELSSVQSATQEMAAAAGSFLDSLEPGQKEKATFEFKSEERYNWHYIPRSRKGLPWTEMKADQRLLAHALLGSGLSTRGYVKATTIMYLEQILHELEDQSPRRNPELYYVSIFGNPGPESTWGWRVEGHHLSVNFTIVDGENIAATPSFFGANPAEVRQGPQKGLRALAEEEDLAWDLVRSLSDEQKETAIFSDEAPGEILTGADRDVSPLKQIGLTYAKMNREQKHLLRSLIEEYIRRNRPELADQDLLDIRRAGVDNIRFAWAGGLEAGQGHYYRIQGPTFLLEFANTQNNANHIHAAWRDFENDYGQDLLREHYENHDH